MRAANTVLYVEDDPANRSLMGTIFARYFPRLSLQTAHDGREALDLLACTVPRLLLLDGYLGDMTAAGFIEALRARSVAVPPIVVVSGSLPSETVTAIEGIAGSLTKPFQIAELVELVAGLLEERPDT